MHTFCPKAWLTDADEVEILPQLWIVENAKRKKEPCKAAPLFDQFPSFSGANLRVFWQGPTIGVDLGADGARTMMLVYNLPRSDAIYEQYNGIAGAAYFVAGLGMTALTSADETIVVVPIRSGLGLRLGYNVGYLKFTASATWNPF